MSDSPAIPATHHNHEACIDAALKQAEMACQRAGERLTPLRRRVLALVWNSHEPVKAYDLLERLRPDQPRAQPVTVYRALEFLARHGLVHRIESLNAFVGCSLPDAPHQSQFLICRACEQSAEIADPEVTRLLARKATDAGFTQLKPTVEVHGLCARCAGDD